MTLTHSVVSKFGNKVRVGHLNQPLPQGLAYHYNTDRYAVSYKTPDGTYSARRFPADKLDEALEFHAKADAEKQARAIERKREDLKLPPQVLANRKADQNFVVNERPRATVQHLSKKLSEFGFDVALPGREVPSASFLVRRTGQPDHAWLPVVLRTCGGAQRNRKSFQFTMVTGHQKALLLCISFNGDDVPPHIWTFHGQPVHDKISALNADSLGITPSGANERLGIYHGSGAFAVQSFAAHLQNICDGLVNDPYLFCALDHPLWCVARPAIFAWRWAIHMYERRFPGPLTWTSDGTKCFDFKHTCNGVTQRVVFTMAVEARRNHDGTLKADRQARNTGFVAHFQKTNHDAFHRGDFDLAVFAHFDAANRRVHFWRFPHDALLSRLAHDDTPGKTSIILQLPEDECDRTGYLPARVHALSNNMGAQNNSLWTRAFSSSHSFEDQDRPPVPLPDRLAHLHWDDAVRASSHRA